MIDENKAEKMLFDIVKTANNNRDNEGSIKLHHYLLGDIKQEITAEYKKFFEQTEGISNVKVIGKGSLTMTVDSFLIDELLKEEE